MKDPASSIENRQNSINCPSCGSTTCRTIYRVSAVPIHSCILLDTEDAARSFPRRDLSLAYCDACGFIFNHLFDQGVMHYSTNFEESQHFSGTFNAFAKKLAVEIAQKCDVSGKHILEIGCGKGEFLRELCKIGDASGLGIDPAYRPDQGRSMPQDNVRFITDFFSPSYKYVSADIILCRHTLEHISPVATFVRSIREMIGPGSDTRVFFETPDAKRVLTEGAFWDIYYEHCSYFSPGTHARLFRREGFEVTDLMLLYDNQYIGQYAQVAKEATGSHLQLEEDLDEVCTLVASFSDRVTQAHDYWRRVVRSAWADGRRIVLWGGGSKGVAFLTTLGLADEISSVVDVNPYKQGKFMPGTGHPVIAPKSLLDYRPDLVIVMNPIYLSEVSSSLQRLGLGSRVISLGPTNHSRHEYGF